MSESNKALVRTFIEEVINQNRFDLLDGILADGFVYHEPYLGDLNGVDGYRQLVTMWRIAFPDVKFTIREQLAEEQTVITLGVATGTHTGPLMGIPPTGRRISSPCILISRFAHGKIAESWEHYDAAAMLHQLGVADGTAFPKVA